MDGHRLSKHHVIAEVTGGPFGVNTGIDQEASLLSVLGPHYDCRRVADVSRLNTDQNAAQLRLSRALPRDPAKGRQERDPSASQQARHPQPACRGGPQGQGSGVRSG